MPPVCGGIAAGISLPVSAIADRTSGIVQRPEFVRRKVHPQTRYVSPQGCRMRQIPATRGSMSRLRQPQFPVYKRKLPSRANSLPKCIRAMLVGWTDIQLVRFRPVCRHNLRQMGDASLDSDMMESRGHASTAGAGEPKSNGRGCALLAADWRAGQLAKN
jgi:hypothetical protein